MSIHSYRWQQLRRKIIARDGQCLACGSDEKLQVDHIIPRHRGGDMWDAENLQTLCKNCHERKSNNDVQFLARIQDPPRSVSFFSPKKDESSTNLPEFRRISGDSAFLDGDDV